MAPISRDDFQVGEWQVCPALNEITRGDEVRHLEPKVMDVLCCMARHAGEVLAKERLIQGVWADTFVTDDALKYTIVALRKVLDDDANDPKYIRTIPRRGYQLVAEVQLPAGPESSSDSRRRSQIVGITAVFLILLVVTLGWWMLTNWQRTASLGKVKSIAVLALDNLSGDPEQEYFADGMTETLITDLSKIRDLKVIARSSSMKYKGSDLSLDEIASELGVDALIEGTVQRENDRVRITIQMIEPATNRNLWANRYDRSQSSILVLQGEVAQEIAREIQATLTPEEELLLARNQEITSKAYEDYLRGKAHFYKATPADLDAARQYFESALENEPEYAPAQAGIAEVYAASLFLGLSPPRVVIPKWREAVLRAVEMDDKLADAHKAMASLRAWGDWDWKSAEISFRRAIELNPNDSETRALYADYLLIMKRPDEAVIQIERALELDPLNPFVRSYYGIVLLYGPHQYGAAIEQMQSVLKTNPYHHVAGKLFRAFAARGMEEEAFTALRQTFRDPDEVKLVDRDYADGGFKGAMTGLAERAAKSANERYMPAHFVAIYFSLAGEEQQALDWLERAFDEHDPNLTHCGLIFAHKDLHDQPRFQRLLRRMNLPQ